MGANLKAFVALGGTRLEKGAGHPEGAVVRVGLYKLDEQAWFFEDIARGGVIELRLRGVVFNQPVLPHPGTAIQHLKYSAEDVQACGLSLEAMNQFNLQGGVEQLNHRVRAGDTARVSVLSGGGEGNGEGDDEGKGSVRAWRESDGSVSMHAKIPYALLRHQNDPWMLSEPGTFFEPNHFHIEFEVLPEPVALIEARRTDEERPGPADPQPKPQPDPSAGSGGGVR